MFTCFEYLCTGAKKCDCKKSESLLFCFRRKKHKKGFLLMSIKLQRSDKHFSSFGGLSVINSFINTRNFGGLIEPFVPSLRSGKVRSMNKFGDLLRGFSAGAQCLEDMDVLSKDIGFRAACGGRSYCSKTFGDFLRGFDGSIFSEFSQVLSRFSWGLRSKICDSKEVIFDCDSTLNQQYGLKMEGVEMNYQKHLSLHTMHVYDDLGFSYFHDVKPGATHTSHDISGVVHRLLSTLGTKLKSKRVRMRADSGYCSQHFINACYAKGVEYVVSFKKRDNFHTIAGQVQEWTRCDPKEKKAIVVYDGRECEVGETNYRMGGCTQRSRLVIIRAKKPVEEGYDSPLVESVHNYDYFAFATNIPESLMDSKELIRFYRKRGHAENFIREAKYGFDLKHYPCQKLSANKAYGMIAAFAQSVMRFIALVDNKDKPHFSKAIRNKYLLLACQVVRRGREVFFKLHEKVYEEVKHLMNKISSFSFVFT